MGSIFEHIYHCLRVLTSVYFLFFLNLFFISFYFFRPWKNSDGQVTLFQQALRNPDVFNFADHQYHPVAVEVLKVPPGNAASYSFVKTVFGLSFSYL